MTGYEDRSNHGSGAAIEAAGMAEMSNISYAPHLAFMSRERYSEALCVTKQTLNDPVQVITDTTYTLFIVLGLFEVP